MDDVFFWISKLSWLLVSPHTIIVLWLALGVLFLWIKREILGRYILGFLLFTVLVIGFTPLEEWTLGPLEKRYQPNPSLTNVDGIIVLAASEQPLLSGIWDQVILGDESERIMNFMMLARRFPEAQLVFTGGTSSLLDQELKGADIARRLFLEQGLDVANIVFERDSRTTYESVVFSEQLINPQPSQDWVLVTSASHMVRSVNVFCKVGWSVIPYPVDFETHRDKVRIHWDLEESLRLLSKGLHEWLGIAAYRLSGRSC